jgi:O-antigen/teichoic acid export membrane protein
MLPLWAKDVTSRALLIFFAIPFLFFVKGDFPIKFLLVIWLLSLYISRSFDALFYFEKRLKELLIVDLLSFTLFILLILSNSIQLSLHALFMWQIASQLVKCSLGMYLFKVGSHLSSYRIDIEYLRNSFSFFLPVFIGFVQGKADLYVVMTLLPKQELGKYQILLNLLSLIHGVFASGLLPFTKNVYRLSNDSLGKLTHFLSWLGCLLAVPYLFFLRYLISEVYHFSFSSWLYLISFFQIVPFLLYFTKTIVLFKHEKQIWVTWTCLITGLVNILICFASIPTFGIIGALTANTMAQWLTFILFSYFEKRIKIISNFPIR